MLALLASTGCSSQGATTSGFLSLPTISSHLQRHPSDSTVHLCEKLVKGLPSEKVAENCSFVQYKVELNAGVCDEPQGPPCSVPRDATVQLTEKGYEGKITASDTMKSLPSEITQSPWFKPALCGDKGKSALLTPIDIIKFFPPKHTGSPANFTVTDDGPRTKPRGGAGQCNMVFYDDTDKFVEFTVVMIV
jgi:hypothetical protein